MFTPEITTRIHIEMDTNNIDQAINLCNSDEVLSELGVSELLEETKSELTDLKEPLGDAVSERLQYNQSNIISSKHFKTGMMANSVDISRDGDDWLVGDTASSVDGFPYPLAIDQGSKSHWVAPVTFSALHWIENGEHYFSKGHMVSGITGENFVDKSIDDTLYDIETTFKEL